MAEMLAIGFIIERGVMSFSLCGLYNDTFGIVAIYRSYVTYSSFVGHSLA
jgi:hypothetical protein